MVPGLLKFLFFLQFAFSNRLFSQRVFFKYIFSTGLYVWWASFICSKAVSADIFLLCNRKIISNSIQLLVLLILFSNLALTVSSLSGLKIHFNSLSK